ncbi:MAG: flagellar biosynthetic protein FliR [Polyangiaceae bacterium]
MDLGAMLLSQAGGFALVFSRIAGFVATSPFPGNHASKTQRVGLVCVLSWVATPLASFARVPSGPNGGLGAMLVASAMLEIGCGVAIGLTFRFVLAAADVAGAALAQASGLSSANVLDPTSGIQEPVLGRILTLMSMLLALSVGAHRIVISYLLESLRVLPVGTHIDLAGAMPVFVLMASNALLVGVRLSLPIVAVSLVLQLTLAMIARAAPSLQIFSVGLALLVLTTLTILVEGIHEISAGMLVELASIGPHLDQVLSRLAGQ